MKMKREEVCEKLDILLFKYLELVKEYEELQTTLAIDMKNGFFNMSKARYTLGGKSITPLEYDMTMKATRRIVVNNTDEYELSIGVNEEEEEDDEIIRQALKEEAVLLNRKEKGKPILQIEELRKRVPQKDPINWFGFLVPQSLRQSQQNFIQATEQIIKLANIVKEIKIVENEYMSLLLIKRSYDNLLDSDNKIY